MTKSASLPTHSLQAKILAARATYVQAAEADDYNADDYIRASLLNLALEKATKRELVEIVRDALTCR